MSSFVCVFFRMIRCILSYVQIIAYNCALSSEKLCDLKVQRSCATRKYREVVRLESTEKLCDPKVQRSCATRKYREVVRLEKSKCNKEISILHSRSCATRKYREVVRLESSKCTKNRPISHLKFRESEVQVGGSANPIIRYSGPLS